jgi:tetratricopeptide (TPR) repeat protein
VDEEVTDLSQQGNMLLESGRAQTAIAKWLAALELLPEPRRKWETAMWLHASIGDAQRQQGDIESALISFQEAAASGNGYANGFVQLGIGMCLYDLGRGEDSTDPLLRAFMMEGKDLFEETNPKYLDHLRKSSLID